MAWAPDDLTMRGIKFWVECIQAATIIVSVGFAAATFFFHKKAERRRALEQDQRAKEQLAAVQRELQRPYQEKKLNLYLDAARVLAHLAASPNVDREKTEARFWELYWGELAFVESRTREVEKGSVEALMVKFCELYFGRSHCTPEFATESPAVAPPVRTAAEWEKIKEAAITMARHASDEVRKQWQAEGQAA